MSIQVPMSWIEQFMNWYPRHTKLYRRRSKNDPKEMITAMKAEFDELKPFFMAMADAIWFKAKASERERLDCLCDAIAQCTSLAEAKAMARQAREVTR